jgi:hypothetical protein
MAKIKATTVLAHPDTHEPVVLLEGTDCPDWAVDQITNPDVLDQSKPEPKKAPAKTPAKTDADKGDGDKSDA